MDALSRLLTLNDPQGSIDKNCPLGGDWQLPHAAGELSVIRWHTVMQGEAQLEMPTGDAIMLTSGRVVFLPQNSAHRLRQSGKEPTHIMCGSLCLHTTSRYFLPRCRKCYVLPRHRIAPPVSGLRRHFAVTAGGRTPFTWR
ncbi:AraC family transcriptional regulator [Salmonella enterica subsp. arizonae]|uniref:AraC family transcriptional regulator n=1 Tax=Salmonella enterica subsp. arizonae TaxID=59203 RepID=A0A379SHA4_SALER|nr:AraC family transcriptional regulator [Salmonella enterica subsp. arizonae]